MDTIKSKVGITQIIDIDGSDVSYSIQKTIMETGLYSVYLVSLENQPNATDQVLLIEHPPAQGPSKHLLSLVPNKPLSTSELMSEIVEALNAHFEQKE